MKSVKDNMQYDYIKSIDYNKFGAKYLVVYGNDVEMFYRYNKVNLRLEMQSLFTRKQQLPTGNRFYLDVNYGYDRKGNITNISTIHYDHPEFSSEQTFRYDDADQLITASGNNDTSSLYNMSMSYGNYGRINTGNVAFTDPQDPQAVQQQYSNSYQYTSLNNTFAPSSANNGDITFTFGINGSMRKRTDNVQNKTEYYLFNAFDNMKAYSDNGEKYGYYGYDDKGERVYKIQLTNTDIHTNRLGGKTLNVESIMFYPSGYMNLDQYGNYTKHYYADDQRIASKIGSGYGEKHGDGYIFYSIGGGGSSNFISVYDCIKNELGEVTHDTIDNIVCPFDMPNYLIGDSGRYENALFFYHGDHLSSTAIVTDIDANVTKAALYLPFGTPLSIYNSHWELDTVLPKFLFNAKEFDEESKLYYWEARYQDPNMGIFISPDPLFEKKPWLTFYHYCSNNPVRFIDPTGMTVEERNAAIKYMRDIRGTPYSWGNMDCSGTVSKAVVSAGLPNPNKGNANGVGNIAGNSRKVDVSEMREGDMATFKSTRTDHKGKDGEFDHIGIISKINRNDKGEITSFDVIHASSSKGVIEQNYNMQQKKEGMNKYNELKNIYQWDTPDDASNNSGTSIYDMQIPEYKPAYFNPRPPTFRERLQDAFNNFKEALGF